MFNLKAQMKEKIKKIVEYVYLPNLLKQILYYLLVNVQVLLK